MDPNNGAPAHAVSFATFVVGRSLCADTACGVLVIGTEDR
jgi:hypothetical protein